VGFKGWDLIDTMNDRIDEARRARVIQGEVKYGPINPLNDPRCFRREAIEELLDSFNYFEWAFEKGQLKFRQWCRVEEAIKGIINSLGPCV
jgi:hypothetical protein